ncbi:MAG TPA: VOC family protein [Pseudolysinimonas sp.]|jgi:predicted 3-demethylubiquinone-9 3-methyltransferase (glyoxalase superfamily)
MPTITPFIWFDADLQEALDFYAGIFPDAKILSENRAPNGELFFGTFTLAGQTFYGMNGGPGHPLTDAFSLFVTCEDQAEVDTYWDALTADGTPVACGWLTDKFGLSWQIVPKRLMELQADPDPARVKRTVDAMMTMVKLDVAALERAADG